MIEYMRDKYGEEFTSHGSIDHAEWRQASRTVVMESESFPGQRFQVTYVYKTGEMSDGYLALKVNDEVEKEISAVVTEVYGEHKLFNKPDWRSYPGTSPDMSGADYLKMSPMSTNAEIWVTKDSSDKDDDLETFHQALKDKEYYLSFRICYVEKEILVSLDEENRKKYIGDFVHVNGREKSPIIAMGDFSIIKNFEFSNSSEWR